MKKLNSILLCVLLGLILSVTFIACSNDQEDPTDPPTTDTGVVISQTTWNEILDLSITDNVTVAEKITDDGTTNYKGSEAYIVSENSIYYIESGIDEYIYSSPQDSAIIKEFRDRYFAYRNFDQSKIYYYEENDVYKTADGYIYTYDVDAQTTFTISQVEFYVSQDYTLSSITFKGITKVNETVNKSAKYEFIFSDYGATVLPN